MSIPLSHPSHKEFSLIIRKSARRLQRLVHFYKRRYIARSVKASQTYFDDGKYDEAAAVLEVAIGKYKKYVQPSTYIKLSDIYAKQKSFDKQLPLLHSAKEQYTESVGIDVALVSALIANERYDESVKLWQEISRRFDPDLKFQIWPRFSRQYLEKDQFALSVAILKEGLTSWPDHIAFSVELANTYMRQKNYNLVLSTLKPLLHASSSKQDNNLSIYLRARFLNSIAARLLSSSAYKKKLDSYKKISAKGHPKKIAIFTCTTGNYDPVQAHEVIDNDTDYILFTDQPVQTLSIHQTRAIPFHQDDPVRSARYVKTHPHTLLPEYDIAIWIDASVMITGDLKKYIKKLVKSKRPIGSIPHPQRSTLYEEAEACIKLGKDDVPTIKRQIADYSRAGYKGTDMIESGFVVYDLTHPGINQLLDLWWEQIDTYSRRDQLSFSVALAKTDLKWQPIMDKPTNIRTSPDFILTPHRADERYGDVLINKLSRSALSALTPAYKTLKTSSKIHSVDVIVCVHNALTDVKKCLDSIVATIPKSNTSLIVIDDGSSPDTKRYLKKFSGDKKWVSLYRNEIAQGYTKAANLGISKSTADFVILVNSDTIVTKNWIKKLAHSAELYPNTGIVGPLSSAASHQSIPDHISSRTQTAVNNLPKGMTPEDMNRLCEKWSKNITFPLVPLVHGFCFGITRSLIDSIGGFDEKSFPSGYGEENDYCFRATNAGFSMIISLDTYIFHSKSKSYSNDERRINLMKTGAQKLADLHSRDRITRAILTMNSNPSLISIRKEAESLY